MPQKVLNINSSRVIVKRARRKRGRKGKEEKAQSWSGRKNVMYTIYCLSEKEFLHKIHSKSIIKIQIT